MEGICEWSREEKKLKKHLWGRPVQEKKDRRGARLNCKENLFRNQKRDPESYEAGAVVRRLKDCWGAVPPVFVPLPLVQ